MRDVPDSQVAYGLAVTRTLSEEIGPRPPCSPAEEAAGDLIEAQMKSLGAQPHREWFPSTRSFGPGYGLIFGVSLAGAALARRRPALSSALSVCAAATALAESRFSSRSPLKSLRRARSSNVFCAIEPEGEPTATVCLVSHMDSSRSGLMFHPAVTSYLGSMVDAVGLSVLVNALAPLLRRLTAGRFAVHAARSMLALALLLVLEREIRGEDVPGANDNASGVGVCLSLARNFRADPLSRTRVVILVTGSEESGVFGMRDFLAGHATADWLFINFDGVGADSRLRVLTSEGGPLTAVRADTGLVGAAAEVGRADPGLAAEPLAGGSGLPYDSTPVLSSGGHAITVANQDGAIPNYHWPSDRFAEISKSSFGKAVGFAANLVDRLDAEAGAG